MSDLHKIQVTGHLGKDPEQHDTENFKEVKASLGVNNSFKDGNDWKTITTWYPLAFYSHLAEKAMKLEKGQKIFIDGKLNVKNFINKEGKEVTYRKIVVNDFFVCADIKQSSKPAQQAHAEPDFDDEVPF